MKQGVRIEALNESNLEDFIYVCSFKWLNDPIHQQGMALKRQWLQQMLKKYGSCGKTAYLNGKPVAQILFYPEEADVTKISRRRNVLFVECVYNPTPEAQKLGIATGLLHSLVEDAKQRKTCLGNKPCKCILAKAFNTGESLSLSDFYRKNGFLSTPENEMLCLPIEGVCQPREQAEAYEPLEEDRGKAVVFYGPKCQFSYQFAKTVERIIKEVAPGIPIELINEWQRPQESIRRKNQWLVVNAKPIRTFFLDTDKFKEEIRQALD